jgi:hypothetical protein
VLEPVLRQFDILPHHQWRRDVEKPHVMTS